MIKEEGDLRDRDNLKNKRKCCGKDLKKAEEKVQAENIRKQGEEKLILLPVFFYG